VNPSVGYKVFAGGLTVVTKSLCWWTDPAPLVISMFHKKQPDTTSVTFRYPSFVTVNFDDPKISSRFVVGVAAADKRGNSSIKATRPIVVRNSPAMVKNSPCLLGLAMLSWDGSCIVGTPFFCLRLFFLRFGFLDIGELYVA
jgi:hypothetical protein